MTGAPYSEYREAVYDGFDNLIGIVSAERFFWAARRPDNALIGEHDTRQDALAAVREAQPLSCANCGGELMGPRDDYRCKDCGMTWYVEGRCARVRVSSPLDVSCPRCGARAGERCRSASGRVHADFTHDARFKAMAAARRGK